MAAHAAETHSMANLARGLVQLGISVGVEITEVRCVAGRFDLRILRMAQLAAERRIDGRVTHQTVGHLRMVARSRGIAFYQAAMASHAGVPGLQLISGRPRRRQIDSTVDSCSQSRGNISKRQMRLVAEFQSPQWTLENIGFLPLVVLRRMKAVVTGKTGFGLGQIVIRREPA